MKILTLTFDVIRNKSMFYEAGNVTLNVIEADRLDVSRRGDARKFYTLCRVGGLKLNMILWMGLRVAGM